MIHPPCGESCGATARYEAQYEQIGKDEKRTAKKTKKRLQIKTVKENRRRKYYTFKPPSLDDFQNAADIRAERFARKGVFRALHPDHLTPKTLISMVKEEVANSNVHSRLLYQVDLGGLDKIRESVDLLLHDQVANQAQRHYQLERVS